ncbi:polyprenyl synthetase family protein [Ruegeria atlantica]|uniref:polyprenyl synthetase family protein n=1 Tax=Ruegeria atlantica TaxID=81569 RepID=UPI00147BFEA1|nr:farnesyl diphosphate synthase [Ruegeria atlantica]
MFREILAQDAARIQDQFDLVLGALDDLNVTCAMAYAIKGGKRLRGFLVLESARLHGVDASRAVWPATGIEALHAYSLVHDDLPCMDDDDLRRGRPTVHVKWDEGTAVLAGDALQTLAFELCTRPEVGTAEVRAELALTLAKASGAQGMVLGQALDIAAETAAAPLTLDEITRLQAGKTGALIEWSACAGARLAQADPGPLRQYARALGLAFQIADDILDVEGDAEKAGKRLQKDAQAGKATFVSLLGLEAAKARAAELVDQGCAALDGYGASAETLKDAARFVIARDS